MNYGVKAPDGWVGKRSPKDPLGLVELVDAYVYNDLDSARRVAAVFEGRVHEIRFEGWTALDGGRVVGA